MTTPTETITEAATPEQNPTAATTATARPLIVEWHQMNTAEQAGEWKNLVEWVIWIHDLYELSREERLPRCWPQHPGLVEELRSLKAWRDAIYSTPDTAANAHIARSWHGELRQTIAATLTFWAPVCRGGHTDAALVADIVIADVKGDLARRWYQAVPPVMASAPAPQQPSADEMSGELMAAALENGDAISHSRSMPYYAEHGGAWWTRSQDGTTWLRCTDPDHHAQLDRTSAQMRAADVSCDKITREL